MQDLLVLHFCVKQSADFNVDRFDGIVRDRFGRLFVPARPDAIVDVVVVDALQTLSHCVSRGHDFDAHFRRMRDAATESALDRSLTDLVDVWITSEFREVMQLLLLLCGAAVYGNAEEKV